MSLVRATNYTALILDLEQSQGFPGIEECYIEPGVSRARGMLYRVRDF